MKNNSKITLAIVIGLLLVFSSINCGVVKDGAKKEYYDTGQLLSESTYKSFKRHGPYKEYHKNGRLKVEAGFIRGKLHGIVKAYDETGKMILKEKYEKGEIIFRNEYE